MDNIGDFYCICGKLSRNQVIFSRRKDVLWIYCGKLSEGEGWEREVRMQRIEEKQLEQKRIFVITNILLIAFFNNSAQ